MTEPDTWSDARVWRAFGEWRWVPPSARHVVTKEYELAVTPDAPEISYAYRFRVPSASRVENVLDRLREQVTSLGSRGVKVQVTPSTEPQDLQQRLLRRHYVPAEETEVLVWELRNTDGSPRLPDFPMPVGTEVREIRTDPEFNQFLTLAQRIFGDPAPPPATIEAFRSDVRNKIDQTGHSARYLAWREGNPVGRGGLEVVGEVARFWGSGVLEPHRRRGIYGALVRVRCQDALAQGANIAMVTARVGSSGPILKHHGFRVVGSVRMYQGRW